MKTSTTKSSPQQGNTLALTLVMTGILGFLLVTYLSLVRSQNISNMRSQCWNQAVPVIEAGIEDALTQLNTHGATNLACDSWTKSGDLYYIKRKIGDNYYVVTITNWFLGMPNARPIIESRGYVAMPAVINSDPCYTTNSDFFKPAEFSSSTASLNPGTRYLLRAVKIATKRDFLFTKAMAADGYIDLKGNKITSDSFDSRLGPYNLLNRRANGDIATNAGLTNSLNVGQADVWGHVATGPKGTVSIGGNGSVGDINWHKDHKGGIQPGFSTDDMNVDFKDVDPPSFNPGPFTPGPGTNDTGSYAYLLGEGNYQMGPLTLSGSEVLYVTNHATLFVTGDISISGNASIVVASNASLNLYCSGANVSLGGNGVFNQTGNATNFAYWGLPANTNLDLGGNAAFVGTIYAPEAAFTMNGGGGVGTFDFTGASVTATVTMNGNFNFHYDEALGDIGPFRRYIVTRWDEMTPEQLASGTLDYSIEGMVE